MNNAQYLTTCVCGNRTSKKYARAHDGKCKACVGTAKGYSAADASERNLRIMETYGSYAAYEREEGHYGNPDY